MPLLPEQFHMLYDGVAQPVLLVQNGTISACNCAAQGLFPERAALSDCMPPEATTLPAGADKPATIPVLLGSTQISARTQPVDGSLLVFLPPQPHSDGLAACSRAAQAISTPLTTLLSVSGTLFPLFADAEDPVLQQNLAVLNRACYQLLRVSENLSDLSDMQHRRLPLAPEKTDLTEFLVELCRRADDLCRQTGRTLKPLLPQVPVYVWADRRLLRRALLALLSNAIKFTQSGSILSLSLVRNGKRALIRLSDSGEGMGAEVLSGVFHRYTRPERPEDSRFGAGFSLSVVQAVMQVHGGTVLVQSQEGSGTDVLLSLPVGEPSDRTVLRSPRMHIDRSGGFVPELVELADVLPPEAFDVRNFL